MKTFFVPGVMALVAALWASSVQAQAARHNPDLPYDNVSSELTELEEPFLREGKLVNTSRIHEVRKGLTPEQVKEWLGDPIAVHYLEDRTEWDYNLNLSVGEQGSNVIVCQYKVLFDETGETVGEATWRRRQCKLLADRQPRTINLAADFLFAFDKDQLSNKGEEVLTKLYGDLQTLERPVSLFIVGHTDRLGSVAYNQALSERRAKTVANYLIGLGFPANRIGTAGAGKSQPVKDCPSAVVNDALKACLVDNRRVSIDVKEYKE